MAIDNKIQNQKFQEKLITIKTFHFFHGTNVEGLHETFQRNVRNVVRITTVRAPLYYNIHSVLINVCGTSFFFFKKNIKIKHPESSFGEQLLLIR